MLVTELPMVTEVRLVQPEIAESPMVVTELPMLKVVRLMQPRNLPMLLNQLFAC